MDWIKRNLYFVIGTVVAVVLLGAAGFYFYSTWKANGESLEKLHEQYAKLDTLRNENPHPGRGQTDNIAAAKEQQQQLREFKEKARQTFQRIPSIPEGPKVAGEAFITSLRHTIDQLQKSATNSSVGLPPDYSFSFAAQKNLMRFKEGTVDPLSVQLGEVKAICDVLFQAKVNTLDYIHRERIAPEDSSGATDYTNQKSVTNELAVLTPYELKFRCFSPELAAALSGFASSPHGLLVKTVNVEPAPVVEVVPDSTIPMPVATPIYPQPTPQAPTKISRSSEEAAFRRRYGLDPRPRPGSLTPAAPVVQAPVAVAPTTPARGGLQTVLDEKQLQVTLALNVVKLLPPK